MNKQLRINGVYEKRKYTRKQKFCQKRRLENKVSFLELLSKKMKQKYIDLKPLKSQKKIKFFTSKKLIINYKKNNKN